MATKVTIEPVDSQTNVFQSNIRVIARVRGGTGFRDSSRSDALSDVSESKRPLSSRSVFDRLSSNSPQEEISPLTIDANRIIAREAEYSFDDVISDTSTDDTAFNSIVTPVLPLVFKGLNVGFLMYGQSGSGKTYTTFGDIANGKPGGLVKKLISKLSLNESMANITKIEFSVMELYNEKFYDLHSKIDAFTSAAEVSRRLYIAQDTFVYYSTVTFEELENLLFAAVHRRHVKEQALNRFSSRGHCLCRIRLTLTSDTFESMPTIDIVDLSGTENLKQSQAEGQTKKEAIAINKSLSTLVTVVQNIINGFKAPGYGSSKLTRHLRQCLGNNGLSTFTVCCNPMPEHILHTENSLKFGQLLRKVKCTATRNQRLSYEELQRMTDAWRARCLKAEAENSALRQLLELNKIEIPASLDQEFKHISLANSPSVSVYSTANSVSAVVRGSILPVDAKFTSATSDKSTQCEPVQSNGLVSSNVESKSTHVQAGVTPIHPKAVQTDAITIESITTQTQLVESKDVDDDSTTLTEANVRKHKIRNSLNQTVKLSSADLEKELRLAKESHQRLDILPTSRMSILSADVFKEPGAEPVNTHNLVRSGLTPLRTELTNDMVRSILLVVAKLNKKFTE